MQIVLDHDQCKHANAYSDRCLANTLRYPQGHERYCMIEYEEDGQAAITVVLIEGGIRTSRTFHSEEELHIAALEGPRSFSGSG